MSKRQFLVVLALAMMVVGLTWELSRAYAQATTKSAIVHGTNLISTDAESGDIAAAVQQFHDKFCKWVVDKKGQNSDPSFKQTARQWKITGLHAGMAFHRSSTEFNDKQGKKIQIEQIRENGSTFIVIEYQGDGGPATVANGLLAELKKLGVGVQRGKGELQAPKLDQAAREAIVAAAHQAISQHFKAKKAVVEEIDAELWGEAITKLKPIRVRNERGHVSIALSVKDGIEEGLFVLDHDGAHIAEVRLQSPLMMPLSTEMDRPSSNFGPLYYYVLQPKAKQAARVSLKHGTPHQQDS
jgi:hypothetical protein